MSAFDEYANIWANTVENKIDILSVTTTGSFQSSGEMSSIQ